MKRGPRIWKWLGAVAILLPVLLVAYLAAQVFVIIPWRHEHGYNYPGALAKFDASLAAGDTKAAKRWAESMLHYSRTGRESPRMLGGRLGSAFGYDGFSEPKHQRQAYRSLAMAHELAQEYEQALTLYEGQGQSTAGVARVCVKMKRYPEAFHAFCQCALETRSELDHSLTGRLTEHQSTLARQRLLEDHILPKTVAQQLTAFSHYSQFCVFMQERWKETGNDEDYREAMEFIESLASPHEP